MANSSSTAAAAAAASMTQKHKQEQLCPLLDTTASGDDDDNEEDDEEEFQKKNLESKTSINDSFINIKWSTRDFNKNLLEQSSATSLRRDNYDTWSNASFKYGHWSCRQLLLRRKTFLAVVLLALFGFYISSIIQDATSNELDSQQFVPVQHQSHVLGMKDAVNAIDAILPSSKTVSRSIDSSAIPKTSTVKKNLTRIDVNTTTNTTNTTTITNNKFNATSNVPPKDYLVWSDQCKIQNVDPYLPEVMRYFQRYKYKPCSQQKPLTMVNFNETSGRYVLSVDKNVEQNYVGGKTYSCCYQAIERIDEMKNKLSSCINFIGQTQLRPSIDNVLVKCSRNKKQFYINGHAMLPERAELRQRLNKWKEQQQQQQQRAPSVLMIGIDSVSRINLIRAMPKTAQYLYNNEWFEMSGYNKVDDNTFPNLMAVLAGYNKTNAIRKCKPRVVGGLDNCTFIWNLFAEHGYVTAFAEDAVAINTFNYLKRGFQQPPVDYYMRSFLLAAETNLKVRDKSGLVSCIGYKHAAEHIYDYALEFARRYRNDTYFGFFWTNTFSHQDISECSSMDERIVDYLQKFADLGTYNNTIVIFLSDHGIRFGPTRKTWSGHMEERLPFMFIWLPPYLKQTHPEFVNALSLNKNRLTNPYDLHMTLKHALNLTGRVSEEAARELSKPLEDCKRCHSLLMPVLHNRSCETVAIEDHWCTCIPYQSVYKNSKTIQRLTQRVLVYINDYVAHFQNGTFAKRCRPLGLHSIYEAYRAHHMTTSADIVETYRIVFYTKPNKGLFEATVRYNEKDDTSIITGEISRLNMYSGEADCMDDFGAKKYCVCQNWQKH